MPADAIFHSPSGGFDRLGLRRGQGGAVEIVYDDGVRRRQVWRVRPDAAEAPLREALRNAVRQTRVLPALYAELRKRSISIDAVVA